jgi:multicomponent Na+:H+ antiporter subunit C
MPLTSTAFYALVGVGLFVIGLHGLVMQPHPLRKILALNIAGSGVFLVLVALAQRGSGPVPDPVPHAMVLTGIVVSVCATAVALVLTGRLWAASSRAGLQSQSSPVAQARDA